LIVSQAELTLIADEFLADALDPSGKRYDRIGVKPKTKIIPYIGLGR
jgi:hypothetical protein